MIYRPLGDTGIMVSEIGLGCGGLGGGRKKGLEPALEYAYDQGVTFYDTGDTYAEGASEETLGRLFKNRRDKVIIATKYGTINFPDGSYKKDGSVKHQREALAGSLKRLQTDYIDVYLFHNVPVSILDDREVFDELDRLVEKGVIRCYGASIDSGPEALRFLDETNCKVIEININLFNQGNREPFLKEAGKRKAGVIIKVPLAGGTLSGKFSKDYPPATDGRRSGWGEEDFARRLELVEKVRPVLEKPGRTMVQGALAWLLSHQPISTLIPGITGFEKVKENIGAAGMRLSPEEMRQLDDMDDGLIRSLRLRY